MGRLEVEAPSGIQGGATLGDKGSRTMSPWGLGGTPWPLVLILLSQLND